MRARLLWARLVWTRWTRWTRRRLCNVLLLAGVALLHLLSLLLMLALHRRLLISIAGRPGKVCVIPFLLFSERFAFLILRGL